MVAICPIGREADDRKRVVDGKPNLDLTPGHNSNVTGDLIMMLAFEQHIGVVGWEKVSVHTCRCAVQHLELADVAEKAFAVFNAMVSFVERHCAPIADRIRFKERSPITIVLAGKTLEKERSFAAVAMLMVAGGWVASSHSVAGAGY
jgi:hypothetical protein